MGNDSDSSSTSSESVEEDPANISEAAQEIQGWKCTYRKNDPERPKRENIAKRLARKDERFLPWLDQLPLGTATRRPAEDCCRKVTRCAQRTKMRGRLASFYAAVRCTHKQQQAALESEPGNMSGCSAD